MTGKVLKQNKNGLVFEIEDTVFYMLKDPDTGLLEYQIKKNDVTEAVDADTVTDLLEALCDESSYDDNFNKWYVDGVAIYETVNAAEYKLFYGIDERNLSKALTLEDYIKEHHNNSQRDFAESQGVKPQQVTQWLDAGYIVVDGEMYSKRRELNK